MEFSFPNTSSTEDNRFRQYGAGIVEDPAALIDLILKKRKPYLIWMNSARAYLAMLHGELAALGQQQRNLAGDPFFRPGFPETKFEELASRAKQLQQLIDVLGRRFERETLNIAVVGQVNQGKSFLLRTLSGLPKTVIPDRGKEESQLEPLTGAKSTIFHKKGSDVRGRVLFHSEASVLEILNNYREAIRTSNPLAPAIFHTPYLSVDDFQQRPLPNPPNDANVPARYKVFIKELHKYMDLLRHNRAYLDHEPMEGLAEKEIAAFIVQGEGRKTGSKKNLYLAVQEVQINCAFPHNRVGKIALIDLPGLGEATLGGPERLMTALRLDADIALFIWRVSTGVMMEGNEFIELYDTCYKALSNTLPLNEWSFLVLNEDKTINNLELCKEALSKIKAKQVSYSFFDQNICDCSSSEEAEEKILKPVLNHLAVHIGALDRRLASSCAQAIETLSNEAIQMIKKVRDTFSGSPESWDEIEFGQLFQEKWEGLQKELIKLVASLREKSDQADKSFEGKVKAVLSECREKSWAPSTEEIETQVQLQGFDKTLIQYVVWTRAYFAAQLHSLESALDQPFEAFKQEVVNVLSGAGGFNFETGGHDLETLRDTIAPFNSPLRAAFDKLQAFHLSGCGLLGYKIRKELQALEPRLYRGHITPLNTYLISQEGETEQPQQQSVLNKVFSPRTATARAITADAAPNPRNGAECTGAIQIQKGLDDIVASVLGKLETRLSEDYAIPNKVAYAVVADFVDSLVHAREVENQWRDVYRRLRVNIWTNHYQKQIHLQERRAKLLVMIDRTESLIETSNLILPA